jgi:hypothetical protein
LRERWSADEKSQQRKANGDMTSFADVTSDATFAGRQNQGTFLA